MPGLWLQIRYRRAAEALLPHQAADALLADPLAGFVEVFPHARPSVSPTAAGNLVDDGQPELRAMLEGATGYRPNVVAGRFIIDVRQNQPP
jgi:hypothetical protein